jgi:hypothetical protein
MPPCMPKLRPLKGQLVSNRLSERYDSRLPGDSQTYSVSSPRTVKTPPDGSLKPSSFLIWSASSIVELEYEYAARTPTQYAPEERKTDSVRHQYLQDTSHSIPGFSRLLSCKWLRKPHPYSEPLLAPIQPS